MSSLRISSVVFTYRLPVEDVERIPFVPITIELELTEVVASPVILDTYSEVVSSLPTPSTRNTSQAARIASHNPSGYADANSIFD